MLWQNVQAQKMSKYGCIKEIEYWHVAVFLC